MILVADSGSTKTEWVAFDKDHVVAKTKTHGINPVYQPVTEIQADILDNVAPVFEHLTFSEVHFYGAGCIPEKISSMQTILSDIFKAPQTTVQSDLVGAAIALYGHEKGIACIMGTGSNTCFWDGSKVVKNVPALGFILGDEGSGAVLGRTLISDILKNQLSSKLTNTFYTATGLTMAAIIDRVYRQPFPNRFLAGFTHFINDNLQEEEIRALVTRCFTQFFERNIKQYDYINYKVGVIGSVGFHFESILQETAEPMNIKLGIIEQSPLKGLIKYHSSTK